MKQTKAFFFAPSLLMSELTILTKYLPPQGGEP